MDKPFDIIVSPTSTSLELSENNRRTIGNPALLYLATLGSDESRRTMRRVLRRIAESFGNYSVDDIEPWLMLSRDNVLLVRNALQANGLSYNTINLYLSAMKGVAKEAFLAKIIDSDEYQAIKLTPAKKGSRSSSGRVIGVDEISVLLKQTLALRHQTKDGQVVEKSIDKRDVALLATLYGCGPRRSEVAAIKTKDWASDFSSLTITEGKGNKERYIPVPPVFIPFIEKWAEHYRPAPDEPFFCSIDRWGNINRSKLTGGSIADIVKKRQRELGLESLSPHDFRKTLITHYLSAGEDIALIAKLVGHKSVDTTRIYDLRDNKALDEMSKRVDFDI